MWHFRLQSYESFKKIPLASVANLTLNVAISEVHSTATGSRAGSRANMAGQLLAAQLIPSLGITGLAAIPPGKLASHHRTDASQNDHKSKGYPFKTPAAACAM